MVFGRGSNGKKQKHAGGRPCLQPSVVGAGGESATPPSVTVVSAEDAAAASARVEGVYTFKGLLMDR